MNEYLKTCFFTDKLLNEYFYKYIFYKNVLGFKNLDIDTQYNNELSMLHHIYFYKKLRLIYDQFVHHLFNNNNRIVICGNLNDLNNYVVDEDYKIIVNMYIEFEKGKVKIKRKDNIRNIMLTSKYLCVYVINCITQFL